ncbi:MAG: hypothetical protein AAF608_05130 [Pseudomonadota bacterium]
MSRAQLEEIAERYYRLSMQVKEMWHPFICGAPGEPGPDGLHDTFLICPAPGADFFVAYERKK